MTPDIIDALAALDDNGSNPPTDHFAREAKWRETGEPALTSEAVDASTPAPTASDTATSLTYRHGIPARETVSYLGLAFTATSESWSATLYPGAHFGVSRDLHGDGNNDLASTDWWADVDEWTDAIDAAAFSPEPPPRWLVAAWCQLFGGAQ